MQDFSLKLKLQSKKKLHLTVRKLQSTCKIFLHFQEWAHAHSQKKKF
jgi:hypothetical protein